MTDREHSEQGLVTLAEALRNLEAFLRGYVHFEEDHESCAVALWVAHTYLKERLTVTPYLFVTAPDKNSGKTRLLEVLSTLVKDPYLASGITPAGLVRLIDTRHPTVLIDEIDAFSGRVHGFNSELHGLLNTGYRRSGQKLVRAERHTKALIEYDVFGPKALAGNGSSLPDTVVDRAIVVVLHRAGPDEQPQPFRFDDAQEQARATRQSLDELCPFVDLGRMPEPPAGLIDRAAEVWAPLLSIADTAGEAWPDRARQAAIWLRISRRDDDESLETRLLHDIRHLAGSMEWVATSDLLQMLNGHEEGVWADLPGSGLTAQRLAQMLRGFGIRPRDHRFTNGVRKAYCLADFARTFSKYLTTVQGN